uniref:receptor protein-tyrosine kinase n=1 Tax=Panagrolaimus davidi TaxID=227884 RepID=A0A914PUR5_9BILA
MKKVAVKYVRREICTREDMLKEVEELRSCKHSNIVSFIGWIDEDNQRAIVTEFMAGGDLHEYLVNPQQPLTISNAFSFIFQILDAMFYLSHKHILHRDLAARNCLLNETFTTLKISDFGLARKMNMDYIYYQENQRALAFRWMSPEAITSNFKFTVKLDIWSFAILLWEIFMCGAVPYDNLEKVDVVNFLNEGKRLPRPHFCPLELYNVMLWCWDESPDDRPNFDALKSDIRALYSHIEIYESRTLNQSIRSKFNANGYEIPKA